MQLGISTYAYTWAIGINEMLPAEPMTLHSLRLKATELGINTIQIADNLPLHLLSEIELTNFKTICNTDGIHLEVGARGMTDSNLEKYIRIAELIESPILRFVIDGFDFQPDFDTIIRIISNALPVLEEKNITLALENYERLTANEFAAIIDLIGNKRVGICLDTVNSFGAGENLHSVVQLLGPVTVNLHVKEYTIRRAYHKMGFLVEGLPSGDGMLNIPWLIKQVSSQCQSAILEQWVPPEETISDTILKEDLWAKKSIAYLKSIL